MEGLRPGDPERVGRYRLLKRLGAGGMGLVYLGQSPSGRHVAVKIIRAELADDSSFRQRFRQEVTAAKQVGGMFTAPVVDADPDAPEPWMVTAYVAGPSLSDAITSWGPLSVRSVRILAAGLAEGLSSVHSAGLVHRDLKPSNVLLASDGPRIIDFGISRAADAAGPTRTGGVIGSPGFMSPEQARGEPVGPASDIFSLGSVLAYAATGSPPFGTGAPSVLLYRVVYGEPDTEKVAPELRPLIERCLTRDPAGRPTTDQLLAELGAPAPTADWLDNHVLSDSIATPVLYTVPSEAWRGEDHAEESSAANGSAAGVAAEFAGAGLAAGVAGAGLAAGAAGAGLAADFAEGHAGAPGHASGAAPVADLAGVGGAALVGDFAGAGIDAGALPVDFAGSGVQADAPVAGPADLAGPGAPSNGVAANFAGPGVGADAGPAALADPDRTGASGESAAFAFEPDRWLADMAIEPFSGPQAGPPSQHTPPPVYRHYQVPEPEPPEDRRRRSWLAVLAAIIILCAVIGGITAVALMLRGTGSHNPTAGGANHSSASTGQQGQQQSPTPGGTSAPAAGPGAPSPNRVRSSGSTKSSPKPSSTPTSSPSTSTSPTYPSPTTVVTNYFADINAGDWSAAWSLLSPSVYKLYAAPSALEAVYGNYVGEVDVLSMTPSGSTVTAHVEEVGPSVKTTITTSQVFQVVDGVIQSLVVSTAATA